MSDNAFPVLAGFTDGLTKRELFAAMAMQGFASADVENQYTAYCIAGWAVEIADALISELAKEKKP